MRKLPDTDKTVRCTFPSASGAPPSLRSAATIPAFSYPEAAARALGRAADRGDWLHRPAGIVSGELRQPEQQIDERVLVGGRRAAIPADERPCLPVAHELASVDVRQRCKSELGVADQLGEDAARAERDERAEDRILHGPPRGRRARSACGSHIPNVRRAPRVGER